jgi:hypothetical protein
VIHEKKYLFYACAARELITALIMIP